MDSFSWTLLFIVLSTLAAGFIRRTRKDKCLKHFRRDPVTLVKTTGKSISGILEVQSTGMEFIYLEGIGKKKKDNSEEASYIFYKYEYPQILILIRYHDQLSGEGQKDREKDLKRTYKPDFFRRTQRKFHNFFKTIRDSLSEVITLSVSQFQKRAGTTKFASQDKYLSQVNTELIESVGTAHEPLLEKYIGRRIIFELLKGEEILRFSGVLKDYTAEFIEIMDVDIRLSEKEHARVADIIVPQKFGVVRHLGEEITAWKFPFFKEIERFIKREEFDDQGI